VLCCAGTTSVCSFDTSSAVQQSAYLEALDQYIDCDEQGKLRKCLLDEKGNRLRDKDG
jgi:hypothetical protein